MTYTAWPGAESSFTGSTGGENKAMSAIAEQWYYSISHLHEQAGVIPVELEAYSLQAVQDWLIELGDLSSRNLVELSY